MSEFVFVKVGVLDIENSLNSYGFFFSHRGNVVCHVVRCMESSINIQHERVGRTTHFFRNASICHGNIVPPAVDNDLRPGDKESGMPDFILDIWHWCFVPNLQSRVPVSVNNAAILNGRASIDLSGFDTVGRVIFDQIWFPNVVILDWSRC